MMRMSPELMILCDMEISEVELVPPWKLCTAGQVRVQEDSLLILSVHHPPCEAPKGASFEILLATEESHSPNATYIEVPALCLSWQDAMCVNRQISPFTTFWYFWRSKSILHKLYKNLDFDSSELLGGRRLSSASLHENRYKSQLQFTPNTVPSSGNFGYKEMYIYSQHLHERKEMSHFICLTHVMAPTPLWYLANPRQTLKYLLTQWTN